jgi:translation initiation factor 5A
VYLHANNQHKLMLLQLDVTDDDFLSLMDDSGTTKDDVKLPDGEVGDKIRKMLDDGKDVSE